MATLTIKTISKPLAKQVKTAATNRPRLQGFIRGLGQLTHQINTRIEVRSAGHKVTSVKCLDDVCVNRALCSLPCLAKLFFYHYGFVITSSLLSKALNAGGDVISELFLYSFALGLMAWEYKYSSDKAAVKTLEAKLEKDAEAKRIADGLQSLEHRLGDLEKRSDGWGVLWKKDGKAEEKSKATGAIIDSIISGKDTRTDIER